MDLEEALLEAVRRDSVRVPPYPTTALKLQQLLSTPDYSQQQLVEAMRTDAVFTGNLLRLANSPFYRRGEAVTSVPTAVARIGAKELTRLALAATVSQAAQALGPLATERHGVWRQALTAALVCEALAKSTAADGAESFVAGLLHDAGKLLVIGCLEDALNRSPELFSPGDVPRLVERHHLLLGRVLAARWQLPEPLMTVITRHHEAEAQDALIARVRLADRIVDLMERQASLDAKALVEVGVAEAQAAALAALLPSIPATIAAFEAGAKDEAPQRPAPKPAAVKLTMTLVARRPSGRAVNVEVTLAQPGGFSGFADQELQPNRLVEFEHPGSSLSVWAVVQRASRVGELWAVECSLYALSPQLARQWTENVMSHTAGVAA